jgi:glycosyltransferase involved in cell wall biosynthesis
MEDRALENVRMVFGMNSDYAVQFLRGLPTLLKEKGAEVFLVGATGMNTEEMCGTEGVTAITIPMEREIALFADCVSLARMCSVLWQIRPTLIEFGTPKAAFLGMIAGWLTRVPCRVYRMHALRLETTTGMKRWILLWAERLACTCAHKVICVSPSVRNRAVDLGIVRKEKTAIVESANGVDIGRFLEDSAQRACVSCLRRDLNLSTEQPVIGFVGRFTRDKGIPELIAAYRLLREKHPGLRLLMVGDFEDGDPVPPEVQTAIVADPRIVRTGVVPNAAPYFSLMDVCVLPTWREGFGLVNIEAQAAGKAVVTTTVTGAMDSVWDGRTGLLVPPGNVDQLANAIDRLLENRVLRETMGRQGRAWVTERFAPARVREALLTEYMALVRGLVTAPPARRGRWRSSEA